MTTETQWKSALSAEYGQALAAYLKALNEHPEHVHHKSKFELTRGMAYDKILVTSYGQKSVFCFVARKNGDLLKAASYKVPAKGKRGSIFAETFPLLAGQFYRVQ